ncbi:uncharacterized protein LOC114955412 isoform X1 [Acropora millepora]|uniref:uncharacterized protein LOC114955412 isoform X1 n=1 Tax=Acropora millepora TaxID=45264 RepID=UPI001CF5E92C|nr:uncharacterized protein LOC114955412 isoform X1 [Acropora millepora]XP_044176936.1 uncharacterized protein LOC114955412 isoform X1 [Acropora millepora]XP_044176938.1 uncharacterized protein LOC114955412 isoform X1 [Acropora millepora]
MSVKHSVVVLAASLFAWVNCASDRSCASMQSWFPGTNPLTFADNFPYKLNVTGGAYYPSSEHTVYLNGSITNEMKMRGFVGFIVYAENSVPEYPNGHFVTENLPPGVEVVNCSNLLIVQNSTNVGNWTSVKLLWKAPKDGHLAGNITFRASVVEQTSPQILYYEGFRAPLGYQCPMVKCVPCPSNIYLSDSYGCQGCQCGDDICANATCPFNGICQPSVDGKRVECNCNIICAAVYRPVCGTDGETHGNECAMRSRACQKQKEIKKDYDGECNDICANTTCPFNGICKPSGDRKRVECNCNIICAEIYRPVCGTDGETHSNECKMKAHACEKQKEIKKDYDGECSGATGNFTFSTLMLMMNVLAFLWFFMLGDLCN